VLQVVNSSPGNLAPVFDATLEKAMRLCEATQGHIWRVDDGQGHIAAVRGDPDFAERLRRQRPRVVPGSSVDRLARGEPFVHILDTREMPPYRSDPWFRELIDRSGCRTSINVPLRKDGVLLGTINLYRPEVRGFSDKQIALLQNFAAQAVIAIENARLLTETREALKQQTATAEVLQVINSSAGDLEPVFQAIVEKAHALCDAAYGSLQLWDGEKFRGVAMRGFPEAMVEALRLGYSPGPNHPSKRLFEGESVAYCADLAEVDDRVVQQGGVALAGIRTTLFVALRKDDVLLGQIVAARREVRPFTDKEIALVENFAAQAVIAMENARLITETREALEQQTATAEVLGVINSSPGDLAPVFVAMLDKAMRLCEASFGMLQTYDGERFEAAALRGLPPAYAEFLRGNPPRSGPGTAPARILAGEDVVRIADLKAEDAYRNGDPRRRAMVDLGGARSSAAVALRKDCRLLGTFTVFRQEVRPFTDKQIALLQNFAAQAVIAMENARLLTETREALEQQTATAEVLQVINSSPGDLVPVFDIILNKAHRLCGASRGTLFLFDGETFRAAAAQGYPEDLVERLRQGMSGPIFAPLIEGARLIHYPDLTQVDDPLARSVSERGGVRTNLLLPLRKDGALLGMISCNRHEVRPFAEKEIALLENFAAQAVIAMENARLLDELRTRTRDLQQSLEYQTATSEVLQVISRSTFDLQPVLTTLTETAARLCEAEMAFVSRRDGDVFRYVTAIGTTAEAQADATAFQRNYLDINPIPGTPGRQTMTGRVVLERQTVQIVDITADPDYKLPETFGIAKIRSLLGVPLLREDEPIGIIMLARQRVEPFTERQIELVRTFADQAVIVIENTRLLTELRESLEQQQAMAEVLGVINSSPGDLRPVFDSLLEKATQVCAAAFGMMNTYDGERFHTAAVHGFPAALAELFWNDPPPPGPHSPPTLIAQGADVVSIEDLTIGPGADLPRRRALIELGGARVYVAVALRKDGMLLGTIGAYRQEPRPFSQKDIALLQSFAAQAVIAMDNARLLSEIRQRQAELRVTFDNMGDGVAMFDAELRLAAWNMNFQRILDLPDALLAERPRVVDFIRYLATHGEYGAVDVEAEVRRLSESAGTPWSTERMRPDGRVIEVRNNPVPGGGSVVIYSDITERKRAEANIRAARDAAEKALQELRTAQASLLHAQKMAALGQLTAGIAHEIKNPLNFVNNFADLSGELLQELKETTAPVMAALGEDTRAEVDEIVEMLRGNLDKIAEHGKRADGIVKSMLEHSRGVSGERREVDFNGLVEEALNLAYHGARAQDVSFNITLERDFEHDLAPTELAPQEMTRVFLNLFANGFYAATKRQREGAGPDFRPTLKVATRELGDAVEVRVRDNGTGIVPEIRDKLFQPFVTTKPTGEGTGLGLSIAWDIIIQQHGGTIEVDSELGQFAEFAIRLPRTASDR